MTEEFPLLLEVYATRHGSLIVAGDFNIRVDNKSDLTTKKFLNLVDSFIICSNMYNNQHALLDTR